MIVVGVANGKRHKFEVRSRAVDPVWSVCQDIKLSDKRQIRGGSSHPDCPKCFNVGERARKPKPHVGKHRKK